MFNLTGKGMRASQKPLRNILFLILGSAWGTMAQETPAPPQAVEKPPPSRVWTFIPVQAPRPAWPEPGRELHRLDFDHAPRPALGAEHVFIGSSADDTLRALVLESGETAWRFTTGGPIRFAPALWKNPGDLWATTCVDWYMLSACGGNGADWLFEVSATASHEFWSGVPALGPFGVVILSLALGGGAAYVLRRGAR